METVLYVQTSSDLGGFSSLRIEEVENRQGLLKKRGEAHISQALRQSSKFHLGVQQMKKASENKGFFVCISEFLKGSSK